MPIYEYKCKDCGTHIEKRQKISDEPLKICENCGGPVEKQWSRTGFQFKGEGWYVTDYANKGKKDGSSEKAGSEKNASAESTASADTASKPKDDTPAKSKTTEK
jgi:putative FmdB family regulatory protein